MGININKVLFISIFILNISSAIENSSPIGHNLTPTTHTLTQNSWTIGTYALAYGITDFWTIGTSPWMFVGYNMPMIHNKFSFSLDGYIEKISFEAMYFKTFPIFFNSYEQESIFLRTAISRQFDSVYTLYLSLGFQYFFNQRYTYSLHLRSQPGIKENLALSLSMLHEFRFLKYLGLFLEVGYLGLNYYQPYFHTGASLFCRWSDGLIQLGISQSAGAINYISPFQYGRNYSETNIVVHPEVQFQLFL